jgi:hypothetical protein
MDAPKEAAALRRVAAMLGEYLGEPLELRPAPPAGGRHPDALLEGGGHRFIVEWKGSAGAAVVAHAAETVRQAAAALRPSAVPLVAVPYMGAVGRERCARAGVGWLDLSGNAAIRTPGLHIQVDGKANRFRAVGRPSSVFAPKASRIARWLLMDPHRFRLQQELARLSEMDEGYTSRIVARLEREGHLERDERRAVRSRDPDLLLDAWGESYRFDRHHVQGGHIAARSGEDHLRALSLKLGEREIEHAATGLAAAWLGTRFAAFRLVTVYVREPLEPGILEQLQFRDEPRGANTWLVAPKDAGIFHGAAERDGVPCVHPVQAYLDLASQPERASEARDELRTKLLTWKS